MKTRLNGGFTLVELMVTVAIVGIIAAVAIPSYQNQVRKGRRSDAIAALSQIQQAQERWRANNASYATQTEVSTSTSATPAGLGIPLTSKEGYYNLTVTAPNSTSGNPTSLGYRVTATAVTGKSQASDTNCSSLWIDVSGGNYTNSPATCWSK